ncbi:hypothetical protein K0M31_008091 [Melipona bicolor]|uniref:Uncharacterized protein n=1 Tax=Melipona bicolor TaxID=60889 RepID=A0AA40FQX2_9HYME|nr:hypothetical protein K0M31_008091 [Melipona bicolor]
MTRIQQQSPTAGGSLFKLCVLRSIFSDNGVNTTEVIHPSSLFFSRGQHAQKKETNGKQRKEEKKNRTCASILLKREWKKEDRIPNLVKQNKTKQNIYIYKINRAMRVRSSSFYFSRSCFVIDGRLQRNGQLNRMSAILCSVCKKRAYKKYEIDDIYRKKKKRKRTMTMTFCPRYVARGHLS